MITSKQRSYLRSLANTFESYISSWKRWNRRKLFKTNR